MRKFLLTGVRLLTFAMALQPIVSEAEDNIDKALRGLLAAELRTKGPATIERVMNQDEVQRACSTPGQKLPAATAKKNRDSAVSCR